MAEKLLQEIIFLPRVCSPSLLADSRLFFEGNRPGATVEV